MKTCRPLYIHGLHALRHKRPAKLEHIVGHMRLACSLGCTYNTTRHPASLFRLLSSASSLAALLRLHGFAVLAASSFTLPLSCPLLAHGSSSSAFVSAPFASGRRPGVRFQPPPPQGKMMRRFNLFKKNRHLEEEKVLIPSLRGCMHVYVGNENDSGPSQ